MRVFNENPSIGGTNPTPINLKGVLPNMCNLGVFYIMPCKEPHTMGAVDVIQLMLKKSSLASKM
jgi:hypothetical protein